MSSPGPARQPSDLADVVEMLLDKGVVINADIAVSIGDTQLLGIHLRAAIASFETAAKYGLMFPEGTDEERIAEIADQARPGLTGAGDDESRQLDPDDGARHERRAVAARPAANRSGPTESEVEAGEGETDDGAAGDDEAGGGETGDSSEPSADDESEEENAESDGDESDGDESAVDADEASAEEERSDGSASESTESEESEGES